MKKIEEVHTIESIRGKDIAVQCKTEDEARRLHKAVDHFHSYNYSSDIISKWVRSGEDSCYVLSAAGIEGIRAASKDYWIKEGYEIIQCADIVSDELIKAIETKWLKYCLSTWNDAIERAESELAKAKEGKKKIEDALELLNN